MAKMKVYELAKQLEKESKEVISLLHDNGVEVKSHMSSLEETNIKLVKDKLGKSSSKSEEKKETIVKKDESKASVKPIEKASVAEKSSHQEDAEHSVKKKKKIIFVSNPQNSKNPNVGNKSRSNSSERRQPIRPTMPGSEDFVELVNKNTAPPSVKSKNVTKEDTNSKKVETESAKKATENTTVKAEENTTKKESNTTGVIKERTTTNSTTSRPYNNNSSGSRPYNNNNNTSGNRTNNNTGGNRPYNNNNTSGARPYNNNNTSGNRPYNNNNTSGARPYNNNNTGGNRPYNNNNTSGARPYNNNNTGGARPYNNNNTGGNRPYNNNNTGGTRPYNNNNTGGARPYNNNNTGGNRPYNNNNTGGTRPYNNNNTGGTRPYNNNNTGGTRPYNNNNNGGSRPYNNNNSGGSRPYNNNSGGNRPYNNNNTGGYRGQDNRFKKPGMVSDGPKLTPEMRREEDKRKIAQGKERRNRKDRPHDEEKVLRPGSFIKPERKIEEVKDLIKVIVLPEVITIRELAEKMKLQPSVIVKKLFLENKVVTVNQEITYEEAEEIAINFDVICEKEVKVDVIAELLKEEEEDEKLLISRPPVICVMGHVDHGKTSLLDAIKKTNVIDKEAGGITQHIGAYTVTAEGQSITFLDTPGHEAFTSMRMRGAKSTDIAVLVVAADDGVMPQTIEAINHAKAAEIEIIVAINKIDKPNANIDRVKQELSEHELISEEWGGTTAFVPVSAKTGEGIPKLLEMILLTSEVLELKADPNRTARGLVIEARLDNRRGSVASLLVQKGTLHVGDFIAVGACHGKVRAMYDDKHENVLEAGPSIPVEIIGLNGVPNAGDIFVSPENDKEAKQFAETYISQGREKMLDETKARMSLDDLFSQIQDGNLKELRLIVKADVQGSVEAVKQSLAKLTNDEVVVKIIHAGVGAINETDVILASASDAIIIGFNVKPDISAKRTADHEKIDIRLYSVIYKAIEDIEAAMKGMLDPVFEEKVIGHAEIRQVFKASAIGNIAGSYVLDGMFEKTCSVRVTREGKLIFDGKLASLKRFKDDVKEVKKGFECGFVFEDFDKFQEEDLVEAYKMVEVPR